MARRGFAPMTWIRLCSLLSDIWGQTAPAGCRGGPRLLLASASGLPIGLRPEVTARILASEAQAQRGARCGSTKGTQRAGLAALRSLGVCDRRTLARRARAYYPAALEGG